MTVHRPLSLASIAAVLVLGGCGVKDPYKGQALDPRQAVATSTTPTSTTPTDPAAEQAAVAYAVAARSWTPDTLPAQWRKQVALAGGSLRRALRQTGPAGHAEIEADRKAGAKVTAEVLSATRTAATADRAVFTIVLRERAVESGALAENQTTNTATVQRLGGRWAVTAFTVTQ